MTDRPQNRKKARKLLLILGCTSSVMALSAAMLAWAWGPDTKLWTIPAQPVAEDPAPKVDKRWAALQMPVATISGPMTSNKPADTPETNETTLMASLGSSFATMEPSAGPQESSSEPSYTGIGAFNVGGGTGTSWRGKINPNGSGPGALGFPSYSSGGGGGGSGDGQRSAPGACEGPDAKTKPECQEANLTGPDDDNEGGSCVTTTSVINGQTITTKTGDCDDDDDAPGTGGSCVTTTSTINGVPTVTQTGDCDEEEEEEIGEGGSCVGTSISVSVPGQSASSGTTCLPEDNTTQPCLSESCGAPPPGGLPGDEQTVAVPEPGSLALVLTGLAGLLALRHRRR